jgi:ABC-type maltose transport system permease subunit
LQPESGVVDGLLGDIGINPPGQGFLGTPGLALLLLRDEMRTLPLGVADYSSEHSSDTAGVLAFTTLGTLATIPALLLFLALQRRIVSGLQGAVKG